ncbi:unnamed protein product [Urochloa humidicola]
MFQQECVEDSCPTNGDAKVLLFCYSNCHCWNIACGLQVAHWQQVMRISFTYPHGHTDTTMRLQGICRCPIQTMNRA